jgi:hypothetical protein
MRPLGLLLLVTLLGLPATAAADLVRVPCILADGETVEMLARRFHVSVDDLALLNEPTDVSTLQAGAEIVVGFGEQTEHVVARGETLLRIAARYGVTVDDVTRWNHLGDPRRLRAGARLLVYAWPHMPQSSSIGRPSAGGLQHGARLRTNQHWLVHDPDHAFVTRDVARWMEAGFAAVRTRDEDAPRIEMRDASAEHGGPLHGHHSHQSGRDIDLAYFTHGCRETCSHRRVDARSLDADRQWALLGAWLRAGVVEYVFIDHDLQEPLYEAARRDGASSTDLARWFQYPSPAERRVGIIRHASGHRDHLHVRFVCAESDLRCGRVDADADDEP